MRYTALVRAAVATTTTATLAGAAVALAAPAAAAVNLVARNDFDGSDRPSWFEAHGGGAGVIRDDRVGALGNWGYAHLNARAGGWTSIGMEFPQGKADASCTVSVYLRSGGAPTQVNLEVIDPGTWNYVALRTVTVDAAFQKYTIGPYRPGRATNVFRVVALNPLQPAPAVTPHSLQAHVDLIESRCTQP